MKLARCLALAAILALVGVLATWRFSVAPATWYDEGVNLQAARNLADSGGYGLVYGDRQLGSFDVQLTTGPTVIGPVALIFRVFGAGLAQGRAVMVVYTLLAALGLYRVSWQLFGPSVAAMALLVLCATDQAGPASTRDVVGEAAALAYFFWGLSVFTTARARVEAGRYAAAGVLFGLAVLSKGQFGLVLPALVGAWFLSRGRPGGLAARHLAVVLLALAVPLALWQVYQLVLLGWPGFLAHLAGQSQAVSVSAGVAPFSQSADNVLYLLSSPVGALELVGLAYAGLTLVRHGWREGPAERIVALAFAVAWLVWYVGFSVGYARYTIPLAASSSIFLALLTRDLLASTGPSVLCYGGSAPSASRAHRPAGGDKPLPYVGAKPPLYRRAPDWSGLRLNPCTVMEQIARAVPGIAVAVVVTWGVAGRLMGLVDPPEPAAQEMGTVITENVDPQTTTESIEWELDVLTPRAFHHPPPFVPAVPYSVPPTTSFLVDGPTSKAIGLYGSELQEHSYQRVASVGEYDLYRREP